MSMHEGKSVSRNWEQIRLRIPTELHQEIVDAAERQGIRKQNELLSRIVKGSRPGASGSPRELRVVSQLCDTIDTVIGQLRSGAASWSEVMKGIDDPKSDAAVALSDQLRGDLEVLAKLHASVRSIIEEAQTGDDVEPAE
ncbi:MAG: hypothetical protein AAGC81_02195 [Pseudomonadota bacterium]